MTTTVYVCEVVRGVGWGWQCNKAWFKRSVHAYLYGLSLSLKRRPYALASPCGGKGQSLYGFLRFLWKDCGSVDGYVTTNEGKGEEEESLLDMMKT